MDFVHTYYVRNIYYVAPYERINDKSRPKAPPGDPITMSKDATMHKRADKGEERRRAAFSIAIKKEAEQMPVKPSDDTMEWPNARVVSTQYSGRRQR